MNKYTVRSTFSAKSPTGEKLMKKGEAYRLSSSQAMSLVSRGLIVDSHVGLNLLDTYEARVKTLKKELGYSLGEAQAEAAKMVMSYLKRHESLKSSSSPSSEFLAEVEKFNIATKGKHRPIHKEQSEKGVGEWAGYTCNIGSGCSHGCRYCYAESMAVRYGRVPNSEAWQEETLREVSTGGCKKYESTIMFPTTHDVSPTYLPSYRCHLYNMLKAGNHVLIVSKPHKECIQAICSEFSSFRDQMTFRFTIGGLDTEAMRHWEPGAPSFEERHESLRLAFELGYATSISAEPMLGGKEDARKLYHLLAPYVTLEIWFGKMNNIGGLKNSADPEIAQQARDLIALQADDEIMGLVRALNGLPKVQWKDSIKPIIAKQMEN